MLDLSSTSIINFFAAFSLWETFFKSRALKNALFQIIWLFVQLFPRLWNQMVILHCTYLLLSFSLYFLFRYLVYEEWFRVTLHGIHFGYSGVGDNVLLMTFWWRQFKDLSGHDDVGDILMSSVFEDMLKYIYSGEAPNINDHTEELLAAADQYQLEKLKELCEVKLCSKLDVSNCIDLLLLGDLHHALTLKAKKDI